MMIMKFFLLLTAGSFFLFHFSQAQSPCNVLTKYGGFGASVKYVSPENIDSTADYKSAIGIELSGSYNYITISLSFKTAVKKLSGGDLVIQFADFTSINLPLSNCINTTVQGLPVTTCSYIVLDKYVSALKTKTIGTVVFRMADNTFKAIDLKQRNSILKTAITCLNP